MRRIFLFFLTAACCCGISAVHAQLKKPRADEKISFNKTEAVSLGASHEMLIAPVTAEVKVADARQSFIGNYDLIVDPTGRNRGFDSVEAIQAQALFDFTQEQKADMIVCALVSMRTVGEPRMLGEAYVYTIEVKMQGYPANYAGFRLTKPEDIWIKNMWARGQMKEGDTQIYKYVDIENVQEILSKQQKPGATPIK